MKRTLAAVVLLACLAFPRVQAQAPAWVPPLGIPAPSWGVVQVAGPCTVNVPVGGSIPNPVPAGAVVCLAAGTYATNYTSPRELRVLGTAASPVYIRGVAGTVVTGSWEIYATYLTIEGIEFAMAGSDRSIALLAPGNHISVRHSDLHGSKTSGGIAIYSAGAAKLTDVVVWDCKVYDNGDVNATFDQDVHGIAVGGNVSNFWLLDSELARNSGDGIQINSQGTSHHLYVGRTSSHHNKQMGFWVKTAQDVVFSQNKAYGHRPGNSSTGGGFGLQYDPQRVWFLFNESYDNTLGFVTGSGNLGGRKDVYLLGNLFRDNLVTGIEVNASVVGDYVIAHNTVTGSAKAIENRYYAATPTISSNVLQGPVVFNEGGTPTLRSNVALGAPTVDAGVSEPAYALYQSLYGVSIAYDRLGTPRPQGAGWDAGSLEAGQAPSPAPSASPSPSPTPSASPTPTPSPTPAPSPTPVPAPCTIVSLGTVTYQDSSFRPVQWGPGAVFAVNSPGTIRCKIR